MEAAVAHRTALLLFAVRAHVHLRSAARHPEAAIHKAADDHLTQMTLVVNAAFMRGRKAYKASGTDAAVRAIHASLLATLPSVLLKILVSGGNVGLGQLKKARAASIRTLKPSKEDQKSYDIAFDETDQAAIAWAKEHAAKLADGLSETSRQDIQDAIAAALEGDGIEGAYDDILEAVGSEARADMIARTEVMWAANEGQQQGWDQAVDAGLLPSDARVEWIATASEACDICESLDGMTRPIDGDYEDSEAADGPPQHPNCRCTEGIA